MRLSSSSTRLTVTALGTSQTIAWAGGYYLPAVLAEPMAVGVGVSTVTVFGCFSVALIIPALIGSLVGRMIDRSGGRSMLMASNLVFALSLVFLANAQGPVSLALAWIGIGIGMGMGLYDAAFATLASIYGKDARKPITGITLIAGFASTIGWPLSALMESWWGWRGACLGWAALTVLIALPLNALLPEGGSQIVTKASSQAPTEASAASKAPVREMALLAFVFSVISFSSTAMAAHVLRLLEAGGATPAAAIAAAALIGPGQVAARILEFTLLQRMSPLTTARLATLTHPLAAGLLVVAGGPVAAMFTLLHAAGNGIMTILRGTLPLALFGPSGYGQRQGLITAPARLSQAAAPLLFGAALETWGVNAVWITATLSLMAFGALLMLKARAET
jgi:predicted MFS family arabinose efflux permease